MSKRRVHPDAFRTPNHHKTCKKHIFERKMIYKKIFYLPSTYPIYPLTVTGNNQFFFLGLRLCQCMCVYQAHQLNSLFCFQTWANPEEVTIHVPLPVNPVPPPPTYAKVSYGALGLSIVSILCANPLCGKDNLL